jgi:sugar phosphate permease
VNRNKLHYGWFVILAGLMVTIGAHGFGRMSYTLILPAMKDGLGFSYTDLGLLGTGNFVGYLLMATVGGFLATRFGTRLVIVLGLVLMGVTMIWTGFANTFSVAFSARLLTGIGNGAAYVPAMALGSAWFAVERRGFATGIVTAGIGAGTMIGGLLVPFLVTTYGIEGWRFAWYYLGAAVLATACIAGLIIRNRPENLGLRQIGAKAAVEGDPPQQTSAPLNWGGIFKMRPVWYLGIVYFVYGFSYIIYMTFFAAYLSRECGLSSGECGGLWALVGGMSIFCGIIWGGLSDKLGRARGAALAYLVLGISYAIFALFQMKFGFYLSAVVFGLTAWSIPTIMAAAAGDYVGPKMAPAGLGFITLFLGIGMTLGPWVGGYLADLTGSFTCPFLMATGISGIGAVLSLGLKPIRVEES